MMYGTQKLLLVKSIIVSTHVTYLTQRQNGHNGYWTI